MNLKDASTNMGKIQNIILDFIRNEEGVEENYENLLEFIYKPIKGNKYDLILLFHLIIQISDNFHRTSLFFEKIEKIINLFKEDLQNFTNGEIFEIFKSNKRILLFLIEEDILKMDETIYEIIIRGKYQAAKYPQYFLPEIKPFLKSDDKLSQQKIEGNFYQRRKLGENKNILCELIRNDSLKDFITYITQNDISPNAKIKFSIFETNSLLIENKEKMTLIKYAAFFGSIQIFKYLLDKVQLTSSICIYAVHGNNLEIIDLLENNSQLKSKRNYMIYFKESIKCHHNDIANYIKNNYLDETDDSSSDIFQYSLKYYNFSFINIDLIDHYSLVYYCIYDYPSFVNIILKTTDFDINKYITEDEKKVALHYAVENESIGVVKLLLDNNNIDVNIYTKLEIEKVFINKGERKQDYYISLINSLSKENHKDNHIFYDKCDKKYYAIEKKTALCIAFERENIEIIKLLLENEKVDINYIYRTLVNDLYLDKKTALYMAVELGNIEIINLLLRNKNIHINDPYYNNYYDHNNYECCDEEETKTPLYLAIKNKKIEIVKILLENKDIDIDNVFRFSSEEDVEYDEDRTHGNISENKTALYAAVESGDTEIVKLLLSYKNLDPNLVCRFEGHYSDYQSTYEFTEKVTALHLAVKKGKTEIVKYLLQNKELDIDLKYFFFTERYDDEDIRTYLSMQF